MPRIFEHSVITFPPSAMASKYEQSEERASGEEENEEGVPETPKRARTTTLEMRKARDEVPYMTPTTPGKKHNKGKGVRRPTTPERPIPNMP